MPTAIQIPTVEVITPDTGITIVLKTKQTYGDKKAIFHGVVGTTALDSEATGITYDQAFQMATVTLERMIVSWDLVDQENQPVVISGDNIDTYFTEADVDFLVNKTKEDAEAKKKS